MKTLTLDVGVLNGVPSETVFQWQIKEPGATEWKDLTVGTGYDTAVYTTVPVTLDMVGTEYRCVLSSSAFPNQYMTIENESLAGELISKVAVIAISNTTMNTEWSITSSGQTIALPISGNVNVSVDWGDGKIETITTKIVALHKFPTFKELYAHFDKKCLGYTENEIAKPEDMEEFYSKEEQNKYGVVGIEIRVLS